MKRGWKQYFLTFYSRDFFSANRCSGTWVHEKLTWTSILAVELILWRHVDEEKCWVSIEKKLKGYKNGRYSEKVLLTSNFFWRSQSLSGTCDEYVWPYFSSVKFSTILIQPLGVSYCLKFLYVLIAPGILCPLFLLQFFICVQSHANSSIFWYNFRKKCSPIITHKYIFINVNNHVFYIQVDKRETIVLNCTSIIQNRKKLFFEIWV